MTISKKFGRISTGRKKGVIDFLVGQNVKAKDLTHSLRGGIKTMKRFLKFLGGGAVLGFVSVILFGVGPLTSVIGLVYTAYVLMKMNRK